MDIIQFFGRFHVLLLHLPLGILVMAACLEIHTIWKKRIRSDAMQAVWLWGAISAIGTCILGYMLSLDGGYDESAVAIHMTFGISVAVFSSFCWIFLGLSGRGAKTSVVFISVVQLLLLTLTGHYGANMTHGSTFLVEKAPQFVRAVVGLPPVVAARPKPQSLDVAVIFPDIIQPIFESRCVGCHNDQKTKGDLKLNSYAAILAGGKSGGAVTANSPDKSELFRRITLFDSDEDFMPAEGKTPLDENQIAMIRWWIETGALENALLKDVDVPDEVTAMIEQSLGLSAVIIMANEADEAVIAELEEAGFNIRRIMQDEPYLSVIYSTPQIPLSDDVLQTLLKVKDQLTDLKLSRSTISDAQMTMIGQLTALKSLNLADTNVSDAGMDQLSNLSQLQSLNIHSTDVSDAALPNLPELNAVYVSE